jgi:hypothetical protein
LAKSGETRGETSMAGYRKKSLDLFSASLLYDGNDLIYYH